MKYKRLSNRKQRVHVVIEGVHSDWRSIEAGVPQGSVLGQLLFLIYINDLLNSVNSNCFSFADDSFLLEEVQSPHASALMLNNDLASISSWANQWLVTMNETKTKSMVFSLKRDKPDHPSLIMKEVAIEEVAVHEHLGLTLSSNLSWRPYVLKIHQNTSRKLNLLKSLKHKLSRYTLEVLYKSVVRSSLEYADVVWDGCSESVSSLFMGKFTNRECSGCYGCHERDK